MSSPLLAPRAAIGRATAQLLIAEAEAAAHRMDAAISVAVVDAAGDLIGFLRMDGAPPVSIEVAIGKARTAARFAAPTAVFEDKLNGGDTALLSVPGIVPLRGGLPILLHGRSVGAVGISGSSPDNDAAIAHASVPTFSLSID